MTKEQKLARLHNQPTLYEIVAVDGETKILLAYCQRHSFSGLREAVYNRAEHVIRLAGADRFKRDAGGMVLGPWRIRFSGRTQRDAILEGELPYIGTSYPLPPQHLPGVGRSGQGRSGAHV